jgi:hypothetical protein
MALGQGVGHLFVRDPGEYQLDIYAPLGGMLRV